MIHGPCGQLNPTAPCMKNGRCSKKYPHDFSEETVTNDSVESGYPEYRRRRPANAHFRRERDNLTIDNRWVVPHNLYLAAKYDAHVNVEICSSVNSIKYIYKYVYKDNDRAQVNIEGQDVNCDGINLFLDARYVSASEPCWRIFSFPMHKEFPGYQRLAIHLEGKQPVYFNPDSTPGEMVSQEPQETTLTAGFKYNRNAHLIGDTDAQSILYPNFC